MKIAFGFDIFYPETNGVITATINLANNLIEMGHEVYFFVPADKGFNQKTIEKNIHIIRIKNIPAWIYKGLKIFPIYGWYLQNYFWKYRFDIVHNTSPWMMGQALNHAARRFHVPSIATHHTLIDNPIYIKYALKSEKLANAATDAIWTVVFKPFYRLTWMATAPNRHTCDQVKGKYPNLDVRYVSNGIDISRFAHEKDLCPVPSCIPKSFLGDRTLLFIGRLGYEKAIDVTIEAFAIIRQKNPDAKLIVVGRGPAEEDLKGLVIRRNVEDSVLFTGLIPNDELIGSRLLNKVAAFVTASLSENQAMTVIEALCAGAPVICADVDNMTELVSPEQGWYFKGGSISDLAEKMDYVINHPEEARQKGLEAKKSRELFDGKAVAKEFEKLYMELLQRKKDGFYVPGGERKAKFYIRKFSRKSSKKNNKEEPQ